MMASQNGIFVMGTSTADPRAGAILHHCWSRRPDVLHHTHDREVLRLCSCIRLTADGQLTMCLGQEDHGDVRSAYRKGGIAGFDAGLVVALRVKPVRRELKIGCRLVPALPPYECHGRLTAPWTPMKMLTVRQSGRWAPRGHPPT
ncbi:hypothetical protein DM806_04060 [Sphingobium lactosutens]|nr:hypothetical protein [Sphingobium lactosutens]